MQPLKNPRATPEQLTIVTDDDPGAVLIRGSAGSGKTSTALLRLSYLSSYWLRRHKRLGVEGPVQVRVLTFNRTLAGYVEQLARLQVPKDENLQLEISTVAAWAKNVSGFTGDVVDNVDRDGILKSLIRKSRNPLDEKFLISEVDYLLGRFLPRDIEKYIIEERTGRGVRPRVDSQMKRRILDEIVRPYTAHKDQHALFDWNDLALAAMTAARSNYQVVIADEAQDFSNNQVRAIMSHVAPEYSLTFVTDTAQRIYPRYVKFAEAGVPRFRRIHQLKSNYRNTKEIAAFAQGVVDGLQIDEDGSLPNPEAARTSGKKPTVLVGWFGQQMDWIINYLLSNEVDLSTENVGFLMVNGGGWFDEVRNRLTSAGLKFAELQQRRNWPLGTEPIALSTFHSAKGLEFDHVIIPGLRERFLTGNDGADHESVVTLRRLFAMGVGRARKTLTLGYKAEEASDLLQFFRAGTYEEIRL
ncbi:MULTISPECIES: UvrD-helicase domain-containing protein [unclassified Streptomyces]|uniref:UvrD-helicase domain-containing protein n=1 Tax=unclassified Streptomyces TaxID=2593676 RepID=UPI00381A563D